MQPKLSVIVATASLMFLSGCLGNGASTTDAANGHDDGTAPHSHDGAMAHGEHAMDLSLLDGFELGMKGCDEAGGVSLYDMPEGQPGPTPDFKKKGIQDDTGNPKIGSYARPINQESWGIWHISLVCQTHSLNGQDLGAFEGGWVGVRIHPPAWDDSGITRQYFVADLSFNTGSIVDLIKQATGLHASRNLDSKIELFPGGAFHTILDDEDHGVFETHGRMKDYTPKDSLDMIRFWMLINPDGHGHGEGADACECIPISFDVESTKGKYMVLDGTGWLSHSRTDAHGNVPAAAGNVGGMAYMDFDRTIRVGTAPNVVLNETWLH